MFRKTRIGTRALNTRVEVLRVLCALILTGLAVVSFAADPLPIAVPAAGERIGRPIGIYFEIDCGFHRCGLQINDEEPFGV